MNLRRALLLYLVGLHLLCVLLLLRPQPFATAGFFLFEAVLLGSCFFGAKLYRGLSKPFEFLSSAVDYLREAHYTTRFRPTGHRDMDRLIEVYNFMIGELQREHLRLGEQRGLLEQLLREAPLGILTFDFEDRIALTNPAMAALLEAPSEQLLGKRLEELTHPLARSFVSMPLNQPVVLAHQGQRRLKGLRSQFLDRGFARGFIMVEDVTREVRSSERAAYEKLIRIMTHEVNNTMGAASSLLQTCLDYGVHLPAEERGEFEQALRVIISRADHLARFMREYANVVRLPQPMCQPVDLVQLLREIQVLMSAECRRRQIEWTWSLPEQVPAISMDRHQMEQVFLNIAKNALEAIGEHGTIRVELSEERGQVTLKFYDSGAGLTESVKAQLFSPFFTTRENGQGIGLTLCGDILTRHGFDFSLEGGEGQETCFTVRF